MRKFLSIITLSLTITLLTGCGSHSLVKDTKDDLGWIFTNKPSGVPESAYAGGKQYFGDGSNTDDIFTRIEVKIWGDSNE